MRLLLDMGLPRRSAEAVTSKLGAGDRAVVEGRQLRTVMSI